MLKKSVEESRAGPATENGFPLETMTRPVLVPLGSHWSILPEPPETPGSKIQLYDVDLYRREYEAGLSVTCATIEPSRCWNSPGR